MSFQVITEMKLSGFAFRKEKNTINCKTVLWNWGWSETSALFTGYGRVAIVGPVTYISDLPDMALKGHETLMCGCTEHSRRTW